jgi:hypothetical protein
LPPISSCVARAEVPFGSAACWPGVADAPYIALRRGEREIRALTPPLEEYLCASLGVMLTARD